MNALSKIRSTAIAKANRLQRAARHIESLKPAFAEWNEGEIYVCKKTGDFRYRFGDRGKAVAPWSAIARQVFSTAAEFAFAAAVLGDESENSPEPARAQRVDVIAIAAAA